ncbi:Tyrosine-protein kinase [Aphelenchoides besseyi]|nr:Tyrosine-protein kinase [Aphelenchoides besseyi]
MGQKQSTEKSEEKETQSVGKRNESYLVRQANFPNSTLFCLVFKCSDECNELPIRTVDNESNWFYIHNHACKSINQLVEWHCSTLTPINDQGAKIRFAIPRPDWRLRAEQLLVGKEIGDGNFGSVHDALLLRLYQKPKEAVVKIVKSKFNDLERSRLLNEANNMLGLKHRNIIRIYGIVTHEKNVGVVLEKCKGEVVELLSTKVFRRWTAPEALRSREYSSKSDCWSYGVLLFEIFSDGGKVGEGWKREQVKDHVLRGNGWDAPSNTPELYRQIMTACFTFDPQNRCSFAQIRNAIRNNDPDHLLITTNAPERTVSN